MTTPIDRTIHDLEYYQQLIKNGSATDIMRTQRPPAPWHLKPWYIRYEHPGYGFTAEMAEKEQTKIEAAGIAFKKEHPLLYDAWSKVFEGFDNLVSAVSPSGGYFANFVPRRGDISEGHEEGGYIQDSRYFRGYAR